MIFKVELTDLSTLGTFICHNFVNKSLKVMFHLYEYYYVTKALY